MTRILAIGECMVELAPAEGGLYVMGFAGDTFNTAWYLRRLLGPGDEVAYFTAVGSDAVSGRMLAFMQEEGIETRHIERRADRGVGLYMIQLTGAERSFAYWRAQSAARMLAEDPARLEAALDGVDLAYLSGITLAILEPEARARLMAALARARATGAKVAFDPNIRPALWPDAEAMRQSLSAMAGASDVVLPSFEDEFTWFGDADPETTARRYAAAGAGLVVVKDGPRPIITLTGGALETHALGVAPRPVVDTTAAGDSFNAGFLVSHLAGQPLAASVEAGAALAMQVIAERGALVRSAFAPVQ